MGRGFVLPSTVLASAVLAAAQTPQARRQPPPRPPDRVRILPPTREGNQPTPAQPPATDTSARRAVITDDGSVQTTMADGTKRISRPGVCGATIVRPDGSRSVLSCNQVQPATPPLPDDVSAKWLDAHSTGLLDIVRALVGNDQTSIDNYLRNNENAQQTIYERIRVRTDLIAKLTSGF